MKFKIRNWRRFQHYKDRTPQWVKLHREMLSSEDWMMGSDETRLLMIVLILLAAQQGDEGNIEVNSLEYIRAFGSLRDEPDLQPLVESQFIIDLDEDIVQPKKKKKAKPRTDRILKEQTKRVVKFATENGFDEFWDLYGHHGTKFAAQWGWVKIAQGPDAEVLPKICELTQDYFDRRSTAVGFVPTQPNASTYLNQQRWNDEFKQREEQSKPIAQRDRESGDLLQGSRAATRRGLEADRCTDAQLFSFLDADIAVVRAYAKEKGYDTAGKTLSFLMKWYFVETGRHPHE